MAHHHHHDHESSLPKLPKFASQVLFVVVVTLLTWVSIFVYKKLIPFGEYVSEQEDVKKLTKLCKQDVEALKVKVTQDMLLVEDCPCLAKEMVEKSNKDIPLWIKQSSRQERLSQFELYVGLCKP